MEGQLDADRLHIRVFMAAAIRIDRSWAQTNVCSAYWRLYVNSSAGAAARLSDGRLYPLGPGAAHFIPAWIRWDCVNREPLDHLYVHFDLVGIPGALLRDALPEPRSLPLTPALAAVMHSLRAALGAGSWLRPSALFSAKSAVDAALADLVASLPDSTATRLFAPLRGGSPVAPALAAIDGDLGAELTNPDLARRCGCSVDHFVRLFRRHVGQTPAQYVLERRVAAAGQALAFSDEPIDGIAERLGFPDRFYFSRVFARRMGVPPAAYRRARHA
ncbi:MAG TPA: helix-turn-helix transcriptional regulator [Planctomycetota bacterium]|nr:helix-turn-helix transcriptional regulator [Planctomycetota bacterium]